MSQEIRDTFIFYRSFYEMAKEMSDAERLSFFDAICEYALNFKEVELKGIAKICFIGAKPNISANTKRYQNGKLGAEHGKKGGRPKTPKKPLNNPTGDFKNNPKKTPNKDKDVNNNKDLECKLESKSKGFIKPTLQEIQDYCKERINGVNPSKFFDYYSASNWKDKDGKSVKNWKQKIISWESRNGGNETKQNNQTLCQEINKLAGGNLITKIEAAGKSAQLYFENEDSFQKLKKLETSIKDQIKKTIGDKLGTTELEFKF